MSNERERLSSVYGELLNDSTAHRWSTENAGNARILRERRAATTRAVSARSIRPHPLVLDLGSGGHTTLCPTLDDPTSARRIGLDILFERLAQASTTHSEHTLVCADGQQLPFVDGLFDIVTIFTVFSSILDQDVQARIAGEVERVLRPGGFALWYDMRYPNPRNPNIRPLGRRRIERLFPSLGVCLHSLTLAPPIARRVTPWSEHLYSAAASLPLMRSHLFGTLAKPS